MRVGVFLFGGVEMPDACLAGTPPLFVPTLEDSMGQGAWAVGTAADVAKAIGQLDELLGLTDLVIFPGMPGDPYTRVQEQMTRFAEEVIPLLPATTEVTP